MKEPLLFGINIPVQRNEGVVRLARFSFIAQDETGQLAQGTVQAPSRTDALQNLTKRYALVTQLHEAPLKKNISLFEKKVTQLDIFALFQQIAVGLGAGMTLKYCLDSLSRDTKSNAVRTMLQDISAAITGGISFSEALAQQPKYFKRYQCKLIKAGEASGRMPEVIARLAEDMENSDTLSQQIRGAIAYPIFVLLFAFALAAFLLAWGVPQVEKIYIGMGAKLPLPTRILVVIGNALSGYWYLWIIGIAALVWLGRFALRQPYLRAHLENVLMATYPFGDLYRTSNVAFFSRTLALLYGSGLPLTQAMEILQEAMTSFTMATVVGGLKTNLMEGKPLSTAVRDSGYFPSLAVDMMVIGEESGSLDKMLSEINRFYTRRCESAVKALTSLIEPVLTVFIGFVLGAIILGLGLPFLNLPALML